MTNDELFSRLTQYIDKRLAAREKVDQINDKRLEWVYNTLDGLVKRMDEDDVDRTITAEDIRRHDAWITQLATKTSTQLSY